MFEISIVVLRRLSACNRAAPVLSPIRLHLWIEFRFCPGSMDRIGVLSHRAGPFTVALRGCTMNRSRIFVVAVLAASVFAPALRADDEGFRPLFNGKDLTGWVH